MQFQHNLLATILSSLLFLFPVFISQSQLLLDSPSDYFTNFFIYWIFIYVLYFLFGLPFATLINKLLKSITLPSSIVKYVFGLILYCLVGMITCAILQIILLGGDSLLKGSLLEKLLLGVYASVIYYHVSLVMGLIIEKRKNL